MLKEYYNDIPYEETKRLLGFCDYEISVLVNKEGESYFNFSKRAIVDGNNSLLVYICNKIPKEMDESRNKIHLINNEELDLINDLREKNKKELIDFSTNKEVIKNQRYKFYIDAQHGLGNRLRAIGSAAAIAKATDRKLVIVWEPDHHCECRFSDLFDYDGEVIEASFVEGAEAKGMTVFNYMEIECGAEKDKLISEEVVGDIYGRSAYVFQSPHSNWVIENEFIRSLKPSAQVEKLLKGFELSGCVGVHVRMEAGKGLDHNTYDDVSNWTEEGHEQLHYWRDKSHYSHFIKRIEQLMAEEDNLKLFLATDLPETYKIFQECFGEKCYLLKRDVYDRSKEQIIYAFADAILLSRCNRLLGSTWSSFSELAMRLSTTFSKIEMSGKDF